MSRNILSVSILYSMRKKQQQHLIFVAGKIKKLDPIAYAVIFIKTNYYTSLTLSWRRPLSYRNQSNQSIDLRSKSMDWFLYDNGLRQERVKLIIFLISINLFLFVAPLNKWWINRQWIFWMLPWSNWLSHVYLVQWGRNFSRFSHFAVIWERKQISKILETRKTLVILYSKTVW